jgi:hypothetical protein
MRFLAAHEVGRSVRQLPVLLPEMGKYEALDLTGAARVVQPVRGGALRAIEHRAEDAEHPREKKLARRVLAQAVACRAADDRINRDEVEAHIGRAIRPETAEAKIVVDAAVGQDDAAVLERPVFLERQGLVERRKKERIGRRGGNGAGDRPMVAVQFAPTPGAGLHRAEVERRASPELGRVDNEMR